MNIDTEKSDFYLVQIKEGEVIARWAVPSDSLGKIVEHIYLHQSPNEVEIDERLKSDLCSLAQKYSLSVALISKLLKTSQDEIIGIMSGQKKQIGSSLIVDLSSLVERLK